MGGKYEIRGFEYPFNGIYDLLEYTDSWWEARKLYRKAKKMYYSAFIVRNDKNKRACWEEKDNENQYNARDKK